MIVAAPIEEGSPGYSLVTLASIIPTYLRERHGYIIALQPDESRIGDGVGRQWVGGPAGNPRGYRHAAARGLYRIFNAAGYRFYRSNSAPPSPGDTPFDTSTSLPHQPTTTFADGTWYLSMSYFNGVLDSGFLPVGSKGETYLKISISSGTALPVAPSGPTAPALTQSPGGIPLIQALYLPTPDGVNAATQWAVAYTTDGSTPPTGLPTITQGVGTIFEKALPAQANGTVVKVQLQLRRLVSLPSTYVYSTAILLSLTIDTSGPSTPLGAGSWNGVVEGGQ